MRFNAISLACCFHGVLDHPQDWVAEFASLAGYDPAAASGNSIFKNRYAPI
jgi:hypothetical protein